LAVDFVEVTDAPCPRCGALVPLVGDVAYCPECHRAVSVARPLAAFVRCPRCARKVPVGLDDEVGSCNECGTAFHVRDAPRRPGKGRQA
jgi:endogenous inhibitor of DNA gyrase (YacG/DUF329 family)